jgi:DNA-binding MarR family transcriptional regulator
MAKTPVEQQHSLPLLDHLARLGRRAAEASLEPSGLRPRHFFALRMLRDQGGASQQGLAEILRLDPSNVVGLLNELEERNLITRRRDPADRRRHIVELSTRGERELYATQSRLSSAEDEILRGLTPQERATLHELLLRAAAGQLPGSDCAAAGDAESDCGATGESEPGCSAGE